MCGSGLIAALGAHSPIRDTSSVGFVSSDCASIIPVLLTTVLLMLFELSLLHTAVVGVEDTDTGTGEDGLLELMLRAWVE
jgi:hypothetical protein